MAQETTKPKIDGLNSKTQIGIEKYGDCLWDLTSSTVVLLPDVAFEHVYIKIKHPEIDSLLDKKINPGVDRVVLEVVDINSEHKTKINEVIKKLGVKRLILSITVKSKEHFMDFKNGEFAIINDIDIDNLAIDLYFDYESKSITKEMTDLLTHYTKIKHFSIYFTDVLNSGLLVPPSILNFRRYHKHMWALDDYHSSFQLTNVVTKNYLGIGKESISRLRNELYECQLDKDNINWTLKKMSFCPGFINVNDHVDRLSFYYKLTISELSKYSQIQQYEKLCSKYENDLYTVHDMIIQKLMDKV